jgi:hypothetical protein
MRQQGEDRGAEEAERTSGMGLRFVAEAKGFAVIDAVQGEPGSWGNNAEGFFSRMRRGEIGHHHHVAGPYLVRFAQEAAWREDHKREANSSQVDRIVALVMANKPSVDFCGYWQRGRG